MVYPRSGLPVLFGRGRQQDAYYLKAWRDAPITYASESASGADWSADRYEVILGSDATGKLFEKAATLALYNRFYPREVMTAVSDYSLEGRAVRAGDRILQRVPIFEYEGRPLLEMLSMNEVSEVIQEPRRAGFTYITTAAHSEVGEWSARVEWRENNEVVLIIEVVSRVRASGLDFIQRFGRQMQLRAHRLSIENFLAQLKDEPARLSEPFAWSLPRMAPAALVLVSFLLLFSARAIAPRNK